MKVLLAGVKPKNVIAESAFRLPMLAKDQKRSASNQFFALKKERIKNEKSLLQEPPQASVELRFSTKTTDDVTESNRTVRQLFDGVTVAQMSAKHSWSTIKVILDTTGFQHVEVEMRRSADQLKTSFFVRSSRGKKSFSKSSPTLQRRLSRISPVRVTLEVVEVSE